MDIGRANMIIALVGSMFDSFRARNFGLALQDFDEILPYMGVQPDHITDAARRALLTTIVNTPYTEALLRVQPINLPAPRINAVTNWIDGVARLMTMRAQAQQARAEQPAQAPPAPPPTQEPHPRIRQRENLPDEANDAYAVINARPRQGPMYQVVQPAPDETTQPAMLDVPTAFVNANRRRRAVTQMAGGGAASRRMARRVTPRLAQDPEMVYDTDTTTDVDEPGETADGEAQQPDDDDIPLVIENFWNDENVNDPRNDQNVALQRALANGALYFVYHYARGAEPRTTAARRREVLLRSQRRFLTDGHLVDTAAPHEASSGVQGIAASAFRPQVHLQYTFDPMALRAAAFDATNRDRELLYDNRYYQGLARIRARDELGQINDRRDIALFLELFAFLPRDTTPLQLWRMFVDIAERMLQPHILQYFESLTGWGEGKLELFRNFVNANDAEGWANAMIEALHNYLHVPLIPIPRRLTMSNRDEPGPDDEEGGDAAGGDGGTSGAHT